MIALTEKEKAKTYLAICEAWGVSDDPTKDVSRKAAAKLFAYHTPMARVVYSIANILIKTRHKQKDTARHTYWRVDADELSEFVGSKVLANLALGLCGYFPTHDKETGGFEWSDCDSVGGPRNELYLSAHLARLRVTEERFA